MKYIAVICLTVFAWILMRWKKQYKKHILGGFVIVMILLSFIYNIRTLSLIVPFYYPVNQTFYQPGFLENGEYPDSFLPLLLNGKTVYTKDDSISIEQCKEEGKSWLYSYYHNENAVNYLELSGAAVISDTSFNDSFVNAKQAEEFTDLGYANDMFRYSFLLNDFWEELGNYFTYYWYYSDYLPQIHIYLHMEESLFDAQELVVLWNGSPQNEAEDLYIMSKAYYESEVW